MEFNNKQNKPYNTEDGLIWNSRSVAVVGHIYCETKDGMFVLIGKRGPKGDMPGMWNLPCGYLDWNENLAGALHREIWEETGLDLMLYVFNQLKHSDAHQPFFVNSEPQENRQNVAMHMLYAFKVDELPLLTTKNAEEGEVESVEWVPVMDIIGPYTTKYKTNFAFNHDSRIRHSSFKLLEK